MAEMLDSALFQWEEGERRLRATDEPLRRRLETIAAAVTDELRRRLGSTFTLDELADLYGSGGDWAPDLAASLSAGTAAAWVADAAFAAYAREAANYSGGRERR